ncbi:endonuclease/exonuclease/phosphatase family protein [Tabrizicola sp.]|uniref:endonuclease/exonuclease/phosphatase family protein n=1 Tax=Tabrizicola sp. TaxID=2005166 RepID=UPI00286ACB00|nr:endonuclease/exonuclease/phosphatase family protein [Tabrizicola sp.]
MRIMCLNGWGGKLLGGLLPYVAASAPGVLCLQEVVHSPETAKDWLSYRDGEHVLLQRANFFRDVCSALPDHVATFCPAAQGVLWDDDIPIPSQWGLATFVHRSYPVIGQVQGFVHKGYSPAGYGDHPRSRSAHGVRVYDYENRRAVTITHMHGLRDLHGKMDTPERKEQAHRLLDMSQGLSEADDLRVICGDFNVEPDSDTLELLRTSGMVELVTGHGFTGTRSSQYTKHGKFADYLLISEESAVVDFQVIYEPEVSDHCPLMLWL